MSPDTRGVKEDSDATQSIYILIHNYTIQPAISADVWLLLPLLLQLKETKGALRPRVGQTLFKPDNLYIQNLLSWKFLFPVVRKFE